MEVHDRFDQQTNLDEREKMRAHTHLSRLQTPVFSVVLVEQSTNGWCLRNTLLWCAKWEIERDADTQQLVIHLERRRF